jgi:hypothetical protein
MPTSIIQSMIKSIALIITVQTFITCVDGATGSTGTRISFLPIRLRRNLNVPSTFVGLRDLRGGNSNACMTYTKIGLINLSSRSLEPSTDEDYTVSQTKDDDDLDSSLSFSIIEQWIARQLQSDEKDAIPSVGRDLKMGSLVAIPTTTTTTTTHIDTTNNDFKETSFLTSSHFTSDLNQDVCDTAETLGCLADTIILLYDTTCIHRQKAIIRLIKGIERQRASHAGKHANKHVDVIILSKDDALEELDAIKEVVSEGDEELGDMIQIIPISGDDGVLEGLESARDLLAERYQEVSLEERDVPLISFPLLVRAVYTKFGGSEETGKKVVFDTRKVDFVEEEEEEEIQPEEDDKEETVKEQDVGEVTSVEELDNELEAEVDEDEGVQEEEEEEEEEIQPEEEDKEETVKEQDVGEVTSVEELDNELEAEVDEGVQEEEEEEAVEEPYAQEVSPVEELANKLEINVEEDEAEQLEEVEDEQDVVEEQVVEEVAPVEELNKELEVIVEEKTEQFAVDTDSQLSTLENKQDEVLLDEKKMPILEFGRDAGNILKVASNVFNTREVRKLIVGSIDNDYVGKERKIFISGVNENVRRLFENQLQSLREYYGRRYEAVIEKLQEDDDGDIHDMEEDQLRQRRIKHDKILVEEAKKVTSGFRAAAENAVPTILKNGDLKEFGAGYNYEGVLDGLIRDMMQVTSDLQSVEEEWESVNADIGEDATDNVSAKKRGPVKWYEKLGARVLVFGVNYVQGWLAYQGIKKAAEERDRMMPKFPLF